MALGDHLGSYQDVHLAGAKITQNLQSLAAVRRRVPVQARHPGLGPQTPHSLSTRSVPTPCFLMAVDWHEGQRSGMGISKPQ